MYLERKMESLNNPLKIDFICCGGLGVIKTDVVACDLRFKS